MNKSPHFGFLDFAVAVCIVRVVCIHALNNFFILTGGKPVAFPEMPFWAQIAHISLKYSVPVFVLASGFKFALSRDRPQKTSYWKYIRKRADRLLRPYLIWTVIFYLLMPVLQGRIPSSHPAYAHFPIPPLPTIWGVLNGSINPGYHLWFIPMLFMLTVAYPPVHRLIPVYLSQPLFWIIFYIIRIHHLPIPWMFPLYFAFYDLGARLYSLFKNGYGTQKILSACAVTFFVLSLFFMRLQFIGSPQTVFRALMGLEISAPLFIFCASAWIIPGTGPAYLKKMSLYAWPLFLLHEPLILGRTAWMTYIRIGFSHPLAIVLVVAVTVMLSMLVYKVIERARWNRIMF